MGISQMVGASLIATALLTGTADAKGQCWGAGNNRYQVGNGFLNGQALHSMDDEALSSYTMGFVDALMIGSLFGMTDGCREEVSRCTAKRNNVQLVAIMRKFLKDNPERWHERANVLMYGALLRPCMAE